MLKPRSNDVLARRAAWAGWIGSALEYYDFSLYGMAAVLFLGPLFFPNSDPGMSALAAIATVGAGFVSRAIGAFFLGYLGDVYGRRLVLCLTLVLMGVSTFLIGVLPNYQEIGIFAPIFLVSLRILQGFAVSGEQASVHALVLELAAENRRGLYTSLALSGSIAGFILATGGFLLLSSFLSESDLLAWGWRIPFLLSAVLVAMGLWVRIRLPESQVFLSAASHPDKRHGPLKILWSQYKLDVARVALAMQVTVVSTVVAVFSLSWAVNQLQIPRPTMLGAMLASAVVATLVVPFWAYLSDRIGRRPVFMFGALASGMLIWPYLWAVSEANFPLIYVFCISLAGVAYSAANGVWPSLYAEMFSTKVRLSGLAIGTQLGIMLAAQAPTFAAIATRDSPLEWTPAALLVSASCAVSASAVFFSRETSRIGMGDLGRKLSR